MMAPSVLGDGCDSNIPKYIVGVLAGVVGAVVSSVILCTTVFAEPATDYSVYTEGLSHKTVERTTDSPLENPSFLFERE
jgi:hypothetical protein